MRKLKCRQASGATVQELLDEFNERAAEFGIRESDILNVSVFQPTVEGTKDAKVEIVIIYWADAEPKRAGTWGRD